MPRIGKNTSKYPTNATAIAAFVHQIEIQYPQATKYAGNLPKPNRVYAYGPPVVSGANRPKLPKIIANNMAPIEAQIHPIILMAPYAAREAGNKNTPDPIMFPTTSEVLDQNPIFFVLNMFGFLRLCNVRINYQSWLQ